MNKYIRLSLFALLTISNISQAAAVEKGDSAPDFIVNNNQGHDIKLSNYKGKIVFLEFWASWCSTCTNSLKWIEQLKQKYGKDGLEIIAVNLDEDKSSAITALNEANVNFNVGFDPKGNIPAKYAVEKMPSSFIIGSDGKVLEAHSGLRESDKNEIEQSLAKYLNS